MGINTTGINPQSYTGVRAPTPPNITKNSRAPLSTDLLASVGDLWLYIDETDPNPANWVYEVWILLSKAGQSVSWVKLYPHGAAGASQFPCDTGVANEENGILEVHGAGGVRTSGAGNTITITDSGDIATSYVTNTGTTVPAFNVVDILGDGTYTTTSTTANAVGINLALDVATSFPTDNGTAIPQSKTLEIRGGVLMDTAATAANVVTVSMTDSGPGEKGFVPIGSGGATTAAWGEIKSTNASISVDLSVAGQIDLTTAGSAPGGPGGYAVLASGSGTYNYTPVVDQKIYYGKQGFTMPATADNSGGNYAPGDAAGTAATYTAPVTGLYSAYHTALVFPNPTTATATYYMAQTFIEINGATYYWDLRPTIFGKNTFSGGSSIETSIPSGTFVFPATVGDVIRFGYTLDNVGIGSQLQVATLSIFLINTY